MAITWPSQFQQILNQDSFNLRVGDTVLRTDMDIGPTKIRRRFTKSIDTITCTIDLKFSDYSSFYTFFDVTLNGGTLPFEFNHPITGVLTEFRFKSTPSFNPLGGGYFRVSMEWETLP